MGYCIIGKCHFRFIASHEIETHLSPSEGNTPRCCITVIAVCINTCRKQVMIKEATQINDCFAKGMTIASQPQFLKTNRGHAFLNWEQIGGNLVPVSPVSSTSSSSFGPRP